MLYPETKSAGKLEQARALIRGAVFEALHSADKSEVKPPLTDRFVFFMRIWPGFSVASIFGLEKSL